MNVRDARQFYNTTKNGFLLLQTSQSFPATAILNFR